MFQQVSGPLMALTQLVFAVLVLWVGVLFL